LNSIKRKENIKTENYSGQVAPASGAQDLDSNPVQGCQILYNIPKLEKNTK
jgi:hypothetical protein